MKQKLLKTMRGLLVAAGLCVGGNAWGQTTAFSQDFTAITPEGATEVSTDPADYGFTKTAETAQDGQSATVTNGIFQMVCGGYNRGSRGYTYTASFTPVGEGNTVTFACTWKTGSATGNDTQSYSKLALTDGTNNVLEIINYGQPQTMWVNGSQVASGVARDGSYAVTATINMDTKKITALSIGSIYTSTSAIDFMSSSATSISAFVFAHYARASWTNTSSIDNVSITYKVNTSSYADVTFKYEDTEGNDLSSLKADVVESAEVGASIADIITSTLKSTFYNGDNSIRYDYSTFACSDETVKAGGSTVTLKFAAKAKYTYNVYAVDGSENQLATIATATAYAGDESTLKWSKYIWANDQWYVTSQTTFATTVTAGGSSNVVYATSGIAYFFEMENLTRSGGSYLTEESSSYSGNYRLRISRGSMHYTPALSAGVYTLNITVNNSNDGSDDVYVYTRSASGDLSDVLYTHTATKGTTTLNAVITVPEGYSIAFNGSEGSQANNKARMDYMTLTQVTVPVSVASGKEFATFNSDYALDFTNVTGIYAYTAKVSADGSSVTLAKVTGAVPANTGLLIRKAGESTSADVPVVAAADAVENDFIAVTAANCDENQEYKTVTEGFILATVSDKQGFYKANATNGTQVAKGKAYLPATGAARLTMNFGDEANGISDMRMVTVDDNAFYNLNGVRVSQPTKGLYIVNGKKVIIK